jgi:hypothetical protein
MKKKLCLTDKDRSANLINLLKDPAADATDAPQPWRLIVQPYEEDDEVFFCFSILREHWWNEIDRVKPKYSGKNLSQRHFVHHKSHMDWPGIFFCTF